MMRAPRELTEVTMCLISFGVAPPLVAVSHGRVLGVKSASSVSAVASLPRVSVPVAESHVHQMVVLPGVQ